MRRLASALSGRIVSALEAARATPPDAHAGDVLRAAVLSTVQVREFRVRAPLALYQQLVLEPYLAAAGATHARFAAEAVQRGDISQYMRVALEGLEREVSLGRRFLHHSSAEAVRGCYERAAVAAPLPAIHADVDRLLREAASDTHPDSAQVHLYALPKPSLTTRHCSLKHTTVILQTLSPSSSLWREKPRYSYRLSPHLTPLPSTTNHSYHRKEMTNNIFYFAKNCSFCDSSGVVRSIHG